MLRGEGGLFFAGLGAPGGRFGGLRSPPRRQHGLEEKQPPLRSSSLFQGDL